MLVLVPPIKAGFAGFARGLDAFKKGFTVFVPTTVPTPTVNFASVVFDPGEDMQFRPQIETLFARDITTGAESADGKVHFYGNDRLTCGQLVMFLYRAYGSPDVYINELENSFPDSRDHHSSELPLLGSRKRELLVELITSLSRRYY